MKNQLPRCLQGSLERLGIAWNIAEYNTKINPLGAMDYACSMLGLCMDYAWITHELCLDYERIFMDYAWITHGVRMPYRWSMHGLCREYAWIMLGFCLDYVEKMQKNKGSMRSRPIPCKGYPKIVPPRPQKLTKGM